MMNILNQRWNSLMIYRLKKIISRCRDTRHDQYLMNDIDTADSFETNAMFMPSSTIYHENADSTMVWNNENLSPKFLLLDHFIV